jgi:hypothetical protein
MLIAEAEGGKPNHATSQVPYPKADPRVGRLAKRPVLGRER